MPTLSYYQEIYQLYLSRYDIYLRSQIEFPDANNHFYRRLR